MMGGNLINFDHTFDFGSKIWSRIDYKSLSDVKRNIFDENDEKKEQSMVEIDDYYARDKITTHRDKAQKVECTWLTTVNFYEFVYGVCLCAGLGEKHCAEIPVLGDILENLMIHSISPLTFALIKSDNIKKNKYIGDYVIDYLLKKYEYNGGYIHAKNIDYVYDLNDWKSSKKIKVCLNLLKILSKFM